MRAELDMYSGQPNPTWRLSPIEAAELVHRLDTLPRISGAAVREALGYRGVVVRAETVDASSLFAELAVSGGVVRVKDRQGQEKWRIDSGRLLERWLVDSARPHIDAVLLDIAVADIDIPLD